MNHYSYYERYISRWLKSIPFLHSKFKHYYQSINYWIYKEQYRYRLNKLCSMSSLKLKDTNFFGYYDHSQWSDNMDFFILNVIKSNKLVLKIFEKKENEYIFKKDIISTPSFNYQQGIRAIWIDNNKIIFNYIYNNKMVSSIYNVRDQSLEYYPYPIQEINKENMLFSIDYNKLSRLNPDYGYNLLEEGYSTIEIDGILGYDYINKNIKFILKDSLIYEKSMNKILSSDCEINHISSCPDNKKIIFIYRNKNSDISSKLYLYDFNKNVLSCLFSGKIVSHYSWLNSNEIIIYLGKDVKTQNYYILNINNKELLPINKNININGDGHPSVSPDKRWLVYDSYPDRSRLIHLNLYDFRTNKIIEIGKFLSPLDYYDYCRCDLHPRWSPDGKLLSIDSTHSGMRESYIIDVSKIVK